MITKLVTNQKRLHIFWDFVIWNQSCPTSKWPGARGYTSGGCTLLGSKPPGCTFHLTFGYLFTGSSTAPHCTGTLGPGLLYPFPLLGSHRWVGKPWDLGYFCGWSNKGRGSWVIVWRLNVYLPWATIEQPWFEIIEWKQIFLYVGLFYLSMHPFIYHCNTELSAVGLKTTHQHHGRV